MEEGEEEVGCKGPDKGSMLRVEHILYRRPIEGKRARKRRK